MGRFGYDETERYGSFGFGSFVEKANDHRAFAAEQAEREDLIAEANSSGDREAALDQRYRFNFAEKTRDARMAGDYANLAFMQDGESEAYRERIEARDVLIAEAMAIKADHQEFRRQETHRNFDPLDTNDIAWKTREYEGIGKVPSPDETKDVAIPRKQADASLAALAHSRDALRARLGTRDDGRQAQRFIQVEPETGPIPTKSRDRREEREMARHQLPDLDLSRRIREGMDAARARREAAEATTAGTAIRQGIARKAPKEGREQIR